MSTETYHQASERFQVVAVVTAVREDDRQPKAYLVHEGCQNAMLLDMPFNDAPEPETAIG